MTRSRARRESNWMEERATRAMADCAAVKATCPVRADLECNTRAIPKLGSQSQDTRRRGRGMKMHKIR